MKERRRVTLERTAGSKIAGDGGHRVGHDRAADYLGFAHRLLLGAEAEEARLRYRALEEIAAHACSRRQLEMRGALVARDVLCNRDGDDRIRSFAVEEDRKRVMQNLGASDRARMDQYFTSVRQTELQMEAELQRPSIEAKVSIPEAPSADIVANNASPNLKVVTPLMARLGAIALATDQTRVFNLSVSSPQNAMFVPGDPLGFHQSTHEEPVDPKLGYQPRVHEYNVASMELFAAFLKELDAIQEGDGTLLDHSLVMAFTDQAYARIHSVDGLPILVAGGASGRMKTGYHIAGDNSPVSRVGLTLQKALGVSVDNWGKESLQVRSVHGIAGVVQ